MGKLFSEKYSLTKTPLAILYSAETIVKVKGNGKGEELRNLPLH